jgi:mono/diheme cytochrome c family protein
VQAGKALIVAAFALIVATTIQLQAQGRGQGRGGGGGGAITQGYPQRPPADPAIVERGKLLYSTNCAFCHGADARGGEGASNLLRSEIVLNDKSGELIGDILRNGVGAMPKFEFNNQQTSDVAAFIHSFPVAGYDASRLRPETIVVGDPKAGEVYFKAKCASCHDVGGDLKGFAAKVTDPRIMQQTWLMPGGRGTRPSKPVVTTVAVTLPGGQQLEGQLVRIDDFVVTIAKEDNTQVTVRRDVQNTRVVVKDPLQQHKELLRSYADKDIHNVTAYLESVK